MPRPKSKGAYVPLAAQYFMDDAILEAGADAELLFVRCLSFLASVSSDGFITDRQMKSIVGLRLRNVPKRVDTLTKVGLLNAVEGGFVVRSWTKWNKSAEEIGKLLAKDRERKSRKQSDVEGVSSRNDSGIQTDSELQSSTEQSSTEQSTSSSAVAVETQGARFARPLCDVLTGELVSNGVKVPVEPSKKWLDDARLLVDRDERDPHEARALILWATKDSFWRANILSMPTFRKQYDKLRLARERSGAVKPSPSDRFLATVALGGDESLEVSA